MRLHAWHTHSVKASSASDCLRGKREAVPLWHRSQTNDHSFSISVFMVSCPVRESPIRIGGKSHLSRTWQREM